MNRQFTAQEIDALQLTISPPRFATYLRETKGDTQIALQLYHWNSEISAAFYTTLQFAEVSLRNAVVEAVEHAFGENWHMHKGFFHSLPRKKGRYSPQNDIKSCAERLPTAGAVVAELKFAFWQYMFVNGQVARIWNPSFGNSFPHFDRTLSIQQACAEMFADIEKVRHFRNRIAHHEPIFSRDLASDYARICKIVAWRSDTAARWLASVQNVSELLTRRPHKKTHTSYTPEKMVPGLADLRKMAAILLAEHAPDNAKILVLGAGGGQEMVTFAQMHPHWHQTGVDPSTDMLDLARDNVAAFADRMDLVTGYIDDAPMGPFDGAACLLTLHFLAPSERLATLRAMRARMKSGAALVIAHHSYDDAALWLGRFAQFAGSNGVTGIQVDAMADKLPALPPAEDERLLREAGFENVQLFYAAFSFRGWVAIAP